MSFPNDSAVAACYLGIRRGDTALKDRSDRFCRRRFLRESNRQQGPLFLKKIFLKCNVSVRFQRISSVSEAGSVCCFSDMISRGKMLPDTEHPLS